MNDAANRNDDDRLVILAEIGAAHGIGGEVRIRSHTEDPMDFARYGALTGSDGRSYEVSGTRQGKGVVIARLAGINDRDAAERLNGVTLAVRRSVLPPEADEDEFYHADLIGLDAVDGGGRSWGRVVAMHDFGGGDMLEIMGPDRRSVMVPFSRAAVPRVDLAGGRIVLDVHAAGLADDSAGD